MSPDGRNIHSDNNDVNTKRHAREDNNKCNNDSIIKRQFRYGNVITATTIFTKTSVI